MAKTLTKKENFTVISMLFFDKLHGKELSYNNLLDVDAAVNLMAEFVGDDPTFAILKTQQCLWRSNPQNDTRSL